MDGSCHTPQVPPPGGITGGQESSDGVMASVISIYQQTAAQIDDKAPHEMYFLQTDSKPPTKLPTEAIPPPRQPGMAVEDPMPVHGDFDPDQVRGLIALIKGERMMEMPAKVRFAPSGAKIPSFLAQFFGTVFLPAKGGIHPRWAGHLPKSPFSGAGAQFSCVDSGARAHPFWFFVF